MTTSVSRDVLFIVRMFESIDAGCRHFSLIEIGDIGIINQLFRRLKFHSAWYTLNPLSSALFSSYTRVLYYVTHRVCLHISSLVQNINY